MRSSETNSLRVLAVFCLILSLLGEVQTLGTPLNRVDTPGDAAAALKELVRRGLAENQELQALRNEVEAGEKLLSQSRLLPNPSLEAVRSRDRDGMEQSTMLAASLPLELSGTRGARIRLSRAELEVRRQALKLREITLAYEISVAAVEVAAAERRRGILRRAVEAAASSFTLTSRSVTEGSKAPLDEGLEGVELNRMRAQLERSELDVEVKRNLLRNLLGGDPLLPLPVIDGVPELADLPGDLTELTVSGLAARPDIWGARALEALSEARLGAARADGRPQTELMAGYESSSSRFGAFGVDGNGAPVSLDREMRMLSFGLRISIPVTDRNQGAVAAARAELEAARQRRMFGEATVKREIASARARVERGRRALQILRVGVLEQSRRNLEVVRQSYELGAKSLTEYLLEQRKLLDAEMEYVESETEVAVSRLELMRAVGAKEMLGI